MQAERKSRSLTGLLVAVILVAASPLLAKSKRDNVNDIGNRKVAEWSIISLRKSVAIGRRYAEQIEHSAKMLKDPVVNEYVNRIAQNLASNSDAKVPVSVRVINNPEINAMTLPGGFIFINSGTILAAKNEAQLAAVLAHEIGHVSERSWASEMTKRTILQYAMIPLMFTPMSLPVYEGVSAAFDGIPLAFLKFSRNQEEGADFLGIQYLYKAGYDPNAMVGMFGTILNEEREEPGSVAQLFETHPPTPDRIIKCEEEIKDILPKRKDYLLNTSQFETIQARLRAELTVHHNPNSNPGQPTLERRQPQPAGSQAPPAAPPDIKPPILRRTN